MGIKYKITILLILSTLETLRAQDVAEGPILACEAGEYKNIPVVLEKVKSKNSKVLAPQSTFEVEYTGFSSESRAAFQSAVDVWASYLVSRVPIRVTAKYESINATTLATSGSKKVYKNFTPNIINDTWYPAALANAIAGKDLDSKEVDIVITVNKNISWSFKTDGSKDNFKFDLKTVIMHELAHGLGFTTTFKIAGTNTLQVQWGLEGLPLVYDTYIQNDKGLLLTDNTKFGNPSADLKANTTSSTTFFKIGKGSYIQNPPKLNAPKEFQSGSSISHLDESIYPKGTLNALMSPFVGAGEVNHYVGPVILAILNRIGWPIIGFDGQVITANEPENDLLIIYPNPSNDEISIRTMGLEKLKNADYSIFDNSGRIVKIGKMKESGLPTINVSDLISGTYIIKIGEFKPQKIIKY